MRYSGLGRVVLWIRKLFKVGVRSRHGMAVTGVVKLFFSGVRLTQSSLAAQRATIGPANYFINPEQLLYVH